MDMVPNGSDRVVIVEVALALQSPETDSGEARERMVMLGRGIADGVNCGWDAANGWYDCGTNGDTDPSGTWPYDCL
jgi:hypothetical protein